MKVVAIIQARMNSSRLPGKVMMPILNKPVLGHVVERLSYSKLIKKIVVATSLNSKDNEISDYCRYIDVNCYRGSLDDVLDRYYQAAKIYDADSVVRITADCPVIDPLVVDSVIVGFLAGGFDYYGLGGEFPDGLDCTVFSFEALKKAWENSKLKSEREHVGPYIEKNPDLFKNGSLELFQGLGHNRWTLDEPSDYRLLEEIFQKLYRVDSPFLTHEILSLVKKNPYLSKINSQIIRNEGYLKSLKEDQIIK